jgi:tRNA uridine 5-carboxymethylaminomethyl modification enzyme
MTRSKPHYSVIVIGAGHAGLEAGLASARMGFSTLVITLNLEQVAFMACNPSVGGSAKGQLVREVDALGGQMGLTIDRTLLQIRTLNRKKGPAVRALRAQADKIGYQLEMRSVLENQNNLQLLQAEVSQVLVDGGKVSGVQTHCGSVYLGNTVIVTTGTFLNGLCHVGTVIIPAGRMGEPPSHNLSESLAKLGFRRTRLKTGTPPRILASSINTSGLEPELGEEPMPAFSFLTKDRSCEQLPCYMTRTTSKTRELVQENLYRSPLYSGQIKGVGPRYCPSIEDKFKKFPDKPSHLLYLEPESRHNSEVYLQGFSTSMPHDLQVQLVRSLPGLENAKVLRPGYAVEYDFFDPTQLYASLETKLVENLFFAGQINGTSGYEEAAAQGIVAGLNAVRKLQSKPPVSITRENSYTGVLIHDLVTRGTEEPYRMFSSMVEHRAYIRHDNADARLTAISYEVGLASIERFRTFETKQQDLRDLQGFLKTRKLDYTSMATAKIQTSEYSGLTPVTDLLRRPELTLNSLRKVDLDLDLYLQKLTTEVIHEAEVEIKYAGYIQKQRERVLKQEALSGLQIPMKFDFQKIPALSNEGREKLVSISPQDVRQASLIPGIRQSDLALLISYLQRHEHV